jgi:hypothetical protein
MKRVTLAAALLAVTTWSMEAVAEETAHDKAVAAFQEGRRYMEGGNCDGAITKLRESLAYEPSIGARLSLGECYETRDALQAWRMFRDAANLAYINHDDRLTLAEQRATALEKKLPTIRVIIPASAQEQPGFELRVDGELVDRFDYKSGIIAVKAGRHVVEATAPLRRWSQNVNVENGGSATVTVQLVREACALPVTPAAAAAAAPQPAPSGDSPGSGRRILGLTLAGVGVGGIVSGVVFGLVTLSKKSDIKQTCGGDLGDCKAPPGSVDAEQQSAKTTAAISTASFIAGGVLIAGGGVLFFTAPSGPSTGRIGISPQVSQNTGGLRLSGSW